MAENTMKDLKDFFNRDTNRAVSLSEIKEFWESLTDEEKAEYKAADLT